MKVSPAKIFSPFSTFITLVLLVIISQIILLKPIVGQGLTNEDYVGFFEVRLYKDQMFTDPVGTWKQIGLHNATHDFYIGFLDLLFGENYTMYLYSSIFLKIVATLLLYPLILILTKNRLLAFLTTLLYGISYPSVGALYLYVVGNEYTGIAFLNLFLISYYFTVKKNTLKFLMLTCFLIILTFLASPIRIFPIFAVIILIEAYIIFKSKFKKFLPSILRLMAIFIPVFLISHFSLGQYGGDAYNLIGFPDFFKKVTNGNWYLLLNPLWGFGYTFLPVSYFHIFGKIDLSSFPAYLTSLLQAQFVIFGIATVLLSIIISQKLFRFFLILMSVSFLLNLVLYFIATHHFYIAPSIRGEYSGISFYAGIYSNLLTNYIIAISVATLFEWYITGRRNILLVMTFTGASISLLFILGQWFFTRDYNMYQEGIHRYFVIPAIGTCIFIASLLVVAVKKIGNRNKILPILLSLLIIYPIFTISKDEISQLFIGKKNSGKDLNIQELMKSQTLSFIPQDMIRNDLLIYIRFASSKGDANQWEDTFDWRNMTFWLPIKKSYLTNSSIDGCIGLTWDFQELQKMATIQNESKGFLYTMLGNKEMRCFRDGVGYSLDGKFLNLDNLYAFAVEGPKVINITEEVKRSLIFNYE